MDDMCARFQRAAWRRWQFGGEGSVEGGRLGGRTFSCSDAAHMLNSRSGVMSTNVFLPFCADWGGGEGFSSAVRLGLGEGRRGLGEGRRSVLLQS